MEWVPASPLPPIELTPDERERFAGCQEAFYVRASDGTLAGHHRDPDGVPPPELASALEKVLLTRLLVSSGQGPRAFELRPGWKLRTIKPSPTGKAFLLYFDTKLERHAVGGGHVVEYPVDGSPRVAVTGCEPGRESARLWDADYVGDDDTMVARVGEGGRAYLLLLVRDPRSGRFEEVDNLPATGTSLATCDRVVATSGDERSGAQFFGVVDRRLVALDGPADPVAPGGIAAAFPAGARQIRFTSRGAEFALDVTGALDGKLPAPRAPGVLLRRIAGEVPRHLSAEEKVRRLAGCWGDTRLRDAAGIVFRTASGRVGAQLVGRHLDSHRREMVLLDPGGEVVFHETEGKRSWLAGHPTDERALVAEGASLIELDLRTRAQVVLGPLPVRAGYAALAGGERLVTIDKERSRVLVWAHEPMQVLGDTPLAHHDLGEGGWIGYGLLGPDTFLQPRAVGDRKVHDLVRIVETDGTFEFRNEGQLVRPGTRYDGVTMLGVANVGGAGYVLNDWWFTV
ncbi:MAG: hypothetical protein HS111_25550 [Kofleriaceae bacterium]|nr:hypothetical protein [Kofleriaceae bacterium]MCL4223685.1 hypothetical protein [Myxococcales bacterium]